MEPDVKAKIKRMLFCLLALIFISFGFISAVVTKGLKDTFDRTGSEILVFAEKNHHLQSMRVLFEKTRRLSGNLIIYKDEPEYVEQTINELFNTMNNIDEHVRSYNSNARDFSTDDELYMLQTLSKLMDEYRISLNNMVELGKTGDSEAMVFYLPETAPLITEISSRLEAISDYTHMLLDEAIAYSETAGNTTVIMLLAVSAAALIIIIATSAALFSSVNKTANSLPSAHETEMYTVGLNKTASTSDERLLVSELERCVSDLKAVAYDLSKSAKELKK